MADKNLKNPEVGLLDVVKKCPFCQSTLNSGLTYYVCDKKDLKPKHKLLCKCGWISSGHDTLASLVKWFNTRAGKEFDIPEISTSASKREISGEVF